jgi:hypothetical protein
MAPEAYAELLRLKRSGYSYSSRHARKYLKQMAQEVGREMQRVLQGDTAAPCDIIFMIVWHVLTEIHIHNIVSHLCSLAKKYWPYGCPDLHTCYRHGWNVLPRVWAVGGVVGFAAEPGQSKYDAWRKQFPTREACDASEACMGRWQFTKHTADCRMCSYVYAAANNLAGVGERGTNSGDKTMRWSHAKQSIVPSSNTV